MMDLSGRDILINDSQLGPYPLEKLPRVNHPHGDICQRCTKVCPFNRPDSTPEQFEHWDGDLDYLYQLVNEQREKNIQNECEDPKEKIGKWWLPLRKRDGHLQEAQEYKYKEPAAE